MLWGSALWSLHSLKGIVLKKGVCISVNSSDAKMVDHFFSLPDMSDITSLKHPQTFMASEACFFITFSSPYAFNLTMKRELFDPLYPKPNYRGQKVISLNFAQFLNWLTTD